MAQRPQFVAQPESPIYRLDAPELLDMCALETNSTGSEQGAWRYINTLFDTAATQHSFRFTVEPDASVWRIRYRCIDGCHEQRVDEPGDLINALTTLQKTLWGDDFEKKLHRQIRFTRVADSGADVVSMRALHCVNGDALQFEVESLQPLPPTIDQIGFSANQLKTLRSRLSMPTGMILLTSTEPSLLNESLLAINQELISPERQLLSISDRHRYSLPRTNQIEIAHRKPKQVRKAWRHALECHHDALLLDGNVPEHFHEQIANACDQGTLTVQALPVARSADLVNSLNTSVIRRTPLHRVVTTIVNHYPMQSICGQCATRAQLSAAEQQWLEKLRTPASENVIDWLADGNTEQFKAGQGCSACHDTGLAKPISIYDIVQRDDKSHLFPSGSGTARNDVSLQRQLMSLAKAGIVSLAEVIRVLRISN